MRRALIGNTGFVGSNLARTEAFSHAYNSSNIGQINGNSFDEVWCAGIQAAKWWANKHPKEDREGIGRLQDSLRTIKATYFVLISTVDVYQNSVDVDETTPLSPEGMQPYGLHRLQAEEFVQDQFPQSLIVRLPGLYGEGLKKNLIFDILNDRPLHTFHAESQFQFYGLDRLGRDILVARQAGLPVLNLAVEPVSISSVVERMLNRKFKGSNSGFPVHYDMKTAYAALWGRSGAYLQTAKESLAGIAEFSDRFRSACQSP